MSEKTKQNEDIEISLMDANYVVSPYDDRDWMMENILAESNNIKLPSTLDLRNDLNGVVNQGSNPTCAAQTARCIKEWQEKKEIDVSSSFSHWYVYDNRKNYPNNGMYGRDVMDILLKKGCCLKSDYNSGGNKGTSQKVDDLAKNYKIKSYAKITTIDGVKNALYLYGPCYISFRTYNSGPSFWKPINKDDKIRGGHAVTIVGYNKTGFILRNSWGKTWGNEGYTIFPYNEFGMQGDIWSPIDDKSVKPPSPKCKCF
jgi:C1A family cysteine protease